MKLVLMRHGEAESLRSSDADRALTAQGRQQAMATGKWLADRLATVGAVRVLSSPYRRARETALVISRLLDAEVTEVAAITPDHDPRVALAAINTAVDAGECVVVVTHMPLVAALATWIEEGVLASAHPFSVAEARVFEMPVLALQSASEEARYVPGDILKSG